MRAWPVVRLDDVASFQKGKKPNLKSERGPADQPYLVARYMRGSADPQYASVDDRNSVLVRDTDIIIICDGSNSGETFIGFEGVLASTMAKLSHTDDVDTRFLLAYLASQFDSLNDAKTGMAIPHLDLDGLRGCRLPVPPLDEQRRIVSVLDHALAAIATARANAEHNVRNAKELFESHLNSIFRQRGDGWVQKPLGSLITIQNGFAFRSSEYAETGYFLIRIGNVRDGKVNLSDPKYVHLTDTKLERFALHVGDIVVSLTGNIGRVGRIANDHLPAALNQRVARITVSNPGALRDFVFHYLASAVFRETLQGAGRGAAQQNVSTKEIEVVRMPLPSVEVQHQIAESLDALANDSERLSSTYERKLAALDTLKQSLLHQAFAGAL